MVLGHFRRSRLGLIRFAPEKQDCRGMLPWKVNTRIRRMEHKRAAGKGKPLDGTPYHRHGLQEASSFEKGVWFPLALEMQGVLQLDPSVVGSKRSTCSTGASCKEGSRDPAGPGKQSQPS